MGMKHFNAYTPSRRNMTVSTFEEITKKTPEKSLLQKKKKFNIAYTNSHNPKDSGNLYICIIFSNV